MTNHQRIGAVSNAHAGREFEALALSFFHDVEGLVLKPSFSIPVGVGRDTKPHCFDLGSDDSAVLVECKSHHWTATGNMPSAKITVWNEAMYFFHLAPKRFRKILFVLEAVHATKKETLAMYYIRTHGHLIPSDVSIIEYNAEKNLAHYARSVA